ncbi:hypothetical protein [Brevundimonas sp.]
MTMIAGMLALAVGLLSAAPSQTSDQDTSARLPEVVVEGRIPEELAQAFIEEVSAPPRGATVARWNRELCVGVVGLRPVTAQYMIDRVSDVAGELEVDIGEPGCEANVVVVATTDGEAIARGLVERRRMVLAPGNSVQSRSRRDLAAFAAVDRPVRWWHISTAVDPHTGRTAVRNRREDNFDATDVIAVVENIGRPVVPSLIQSTTRQDLRRALIIIDFDDLGDIDFNQLADYVAFLALAQVEPEADTSGFRTILNLFDDPATPGLSDWDWAYLHGLYGSYDRSLSSSGREAALRREMLRAHERGQGADDR